MSAFILALQPARGTLTTGAAPPPTALSDNTGITGTTMKVRCLMIFAGSPRRAIFAASSSNDVRQSPRKSSTNYYASPLMLARQDGMKITYSLFI